MMLEERCKLGMEMFLNVVVCMKTGIDARAGGVRAAKEARRKTKEDAVGLFGKGVNRLEKKLCCTGPRVAGQ